jgi:serine/threonine-protein kinase
MSHAHAALRGRLQAALGDEFTVKGPLGEGGFAVVFRARDNALSRDVAVKVLDLKLAPSPNLAERFVREARTVARLEHPHIVPIYKVGGRGDVLYLIMRCVDGPSLRALLEREGKLSVTDAARIARQVADALAYAHAHGIVHRDVKPDNVLVDKSGHVLVTDFGIAKVAARAAQSMPNAPLTTEGMILGTPHYMSPEQSAGEPLDARSDIYSLGLVLYHMLAGQPPFDGESAQEILAKQLTATPRPIREVRRDVPEPLAQVLERMIAKGPDRRYATAGDLSRALVAALPLAAEDRVQAPLGRRVARSLRRLSLLGCLAFVAFAAGAAAVLSAVTSDPPAVVARAPAVPDSITGALRALGALGRGERLDVVFVPHQRSLRDALLLTDRTLVRVTPGGTRRYATESLRVRTFHRFGLRGLRTGLVLVTGAGRRDTVYRDLSVRELYEMRHFLSRLREGARPAQRPSGRSTTP